VGQSYQLWSIADLTQTNWIVETNLTGASGDFTQALLTLGLRTNLFLRASESRDYVTNLVFQGLNNTSVSTLTPDTMGAVGPNHFVELINGGIAVYDKSGALLSQTTMTNFFSFLAANGTNYPAGRGMTDPRILFDSQFQRWIACAIDPGGPALYYNPLGSAQAILAISNGESPTNLTTDWTRFLVEVRKDGDASDFTTLGLDANGLYVRVLHYGLASDLVTFTNAGHTIVAIKKPEIYSGQFISSTLETYAVADGQPAWTIQPAVNFDAVPTNGFAWFIAKGPPDLGTNYQGGQLWYRRLQWLGTNAVWADTNWFAVSNAGPNYRDYYDLDSGDSTTNLDSGISAPEAVSEGGHAISLIDVGSRLAMPVIRNGFLWTCHAVGLSGTNGTYLGDNSGTNVDRSAMQWFKLQISPDGTALSLSDHGRVFDPAPTNAWWYYFPSLTVNCAGDMVAGFSGSSATNYIGAFYTWRLANGSALANPRVLQAGTHKNGSPRWGDYSATTLDPTDDWSFWTVQEYAGSTRFNSWVTVIAKIRPNP
jgi:hypothetical protein